MSACEGQQLPVGMVMARYRLHFGCNMKLGDLKPRSLEDLLRSLPGVQVRHGTSGCGRDNISCDSLGTLAFLVRFTSGSAATNEFDGSPGWCRTTCERQKCDVSRAIIQDLVVFCNLR